MNDKTITEVNTRVESGSEKVTTNLTINWDGLTLEETRELAAQSIVIKWQGQRRAEKSIPETAELNATDYKLGTRAPRKPADIMTLWAKMSPEEKADFLKKAEN